jgi:hypothetical protein
MNCPATRLSAFSTRPETKNQNLSRTIGPPTPGLKSPFSLILLGAVSPLLDVGAGVIVGCPAASRVAAEDRAAELIATIARDEVDTHAAGGRLCVHSGDVDGELLCARRVRHRAAAPAAADAGAERHAIDHHALVVGASAIGRQRRNFGDDRAADVTSAEALSDAGNQHTERERIS